MWNNVVYLRNKELVMALGIKERMKEAKTLAACRKLYNEGCTEFSSPSPKTRRRWERILEGKLKEVEKAKVEKAAAKLKKEKKTN